MRRRSRAGGEPAKSQRRKTVRPKRRNAPRAERGRSAYAVSLRANVAQLTHERDEALEQLIATSKVLGVISSSPTDVQPVFDFIVKSAARLCTAQFCHVFQLDGKLIHQVALHGYSPEVAKLSRRGYPLAPGRGTAVARSILNGTVEEIPDILSDRDYTHGEIAKDLNYRGIVAVPMLKDGRPIDAIAITQSQPGRFPERQIQLLRTFADQAVIAIENARLLNELRQRTHDLTEALEQQTATAEILRVISRSPGDLQPVLKAMLANATRLCGARFAAMLLREGEMWRRVAIHDPPPEYLEGWRPGTAPERAALTKKVNQIVDLQPEQAPLLYRAGARTLLTAPLLKDDDVIGIISIYREEVRPFNDKQAELLSNFADQAVIAVENAR